jgi:dipeptidyl aminopeptidase/acylaminoacyl peptidase
MRKIFIAAIILSSTVLFAQKNASVSFEQWISLKTYGSPVISPDGKIIVYGVSGTDWANNAYDNELWMVKGRRSSCAINKNK